MRRFALLTLSSLLALAVVAPDGTAQITRAVHGIPFIATNASSVIASGATIAPTNSIHHISGTAAISTITVPPQCSPTCTISLVPDGAFTTTTGGNISLASTGVVNKVLILVWDGTKWNPSY